MTRHYNWHREATGSLSAAIDPTYNERGVLVSETLTVRGKSSAGSSTGRTRRRRSHQADSLQRQGPEDASPTRQRHAHAVRIRPRDVPSAAASDDAPGGSRGFRPAVRICRIPPSSRSCITPTTPSAISPSRDDAYEPVWFQNQQVEPHSRYEYDALYRLTRRPDARTARSGAPRARRGIAGRRGFPILPADPNALRNYTQTFRYDAVGNIQRVRHEAGMGSWTRDYAYAFEDDRPSRRATGSGRRGSAAIARRPSRYRTTPTATCAISAARRALQPALGSSRHDAQPRSRRRRQGLLPVPTRTSSARASESTTRTTWAGTGSASTWAATSSIAATPRTAPRRGNRIASPVRGRAARAAGGRCDHCRATRRTRDRTAWSSEGRRCSGTSTATTSARRVSSSTTGRGSFRTRIPPIRNERVSRGEERHRSAAETVSIYRDGAG